MKIDMRRFLALSAAAAFAVVFFCCGDETSGPDDEDVDISPYSGIFMIESSLVSNDCAVPAPLPTYATVAIEGDSMVFGGFPGHWDEASLTGTGYTPEYTDPVDPPDCYAYYTVVYEIVYVDADSFSGTFGAVYRKDPGCLNPDPCSYLYNITGSR